MVEGSHSGSLSWILQFMVLKLSWQRSEVDWKTLKRMWGAGPDLLSVYSKLPLCVQKHLLRLDMQIKTGPCYFKLPEAAESDAGGRIDYQSLFTFSTVLCTKFNGLSYHCLKTQTAVSAKLLHFQWCRKTKYTYFSAKLSWLVLY